MRQKKQSNEVPLAVKKELLLTRAMLERLEVVRATQQIQAKVTQNHGVMGAVADTVMGSKNFEKLEMAKHGLSGAMKAVRIVKENPVLSTVASYALSTLGKSNGGWAGRVVKLGLLAGIGYVGYQKILDSRRERRHLLDEQAAEEATVIGYESAVHYPNE